MQPSAAARGPHTGPFIFFYFILLELATVALERTK
jgi:hypothetical protein